jgi:hypothetical protein
MRSFVSRSLRRSISINNHTIFYSRRVRIFFIYGYLNAFIFVCFTFAINYLSAKAYTGVFFSLKFFYKANQKVFVSCVGACV